MRTSIEQSMFYPLKMRCENPAPFFRKISKNEFMIFWITLKLHRSKIELYQNESVNPYTRWG